MNRRKLLAAAGATVASRLVPWPQHAEPALGPKLNGYLRTNWSQDPFSYGSYSFIAKGSTRRDHKRLAEPVDGRLYFAGEAANRERNSTVHAALETGTSVAEELLATEHQSIGVIGAGISGLAAASDLSKAGRRVQVIEARDRIGGRINTDTSLGLPIDLGASWIHGTKNNPLTALADQVGMKRVVSEETWIARHQGKRLRSWQLPNWIDEVATYQTTAGASKAELNESAYYRTDDYGGDEVLFPGGYAQVFEGLKGPYEVSLNTQIAQVNYGDSGVELTTSEGELYSFDAVVVTVPLGVLKRGDLKFKPALPEAKTKAIHRLGMGTLDKVVLQFDEVFWDEDPYYLVIPHTGFERGIFNDWLNMVPVTGEPVLIAFNGGPAALALASESDETVINGAARVIREAYGIATG